MTNWVTFSFWGCAVHFLYTVQSICPTRVLSTSHSHSVLRSIMVSITDIFIIVFTTYTITRSKGIFAVKHSFGRLCALHAASSGETDKHHALWEQRLLLCNTVYSWCHPSSWHLSPAAPLVYSACWNSPPPDSSPPSGETRGWSVRTYQEWFGAQSNLSHVSPPSPCARCHCLSCSLITSSPGPPLPFVSTVAWYPHPSGGWASPLS